LETQGGKKFLFVFSPVYGKIVSNIASTLPPVIDLGGNTELYAISAVVIMPTTGATVKIVFR